MPRLLHIDFETRSAVDLKKVGVHRYAEDPSTGIWCMAWKLEDSETHECYAEGVWAPGEPWPGDDVWGHFGFDAVVNHNAMFERTIWNVVLPCYIPDKTPLPVDLQDDTMARAAALSLPLSLDQLGMAMRVNVRKDLEGHNLMLRMCKPRTFKDGEPVWHDDPAMIERLKAYCQQDVEAEAFIDRGLFPLSKEEREVWMLDQIINDRGVAVDIASVRRAIDVAKEAATRADTRMWYLTDGEVQKCSQVARLVKWLNDERKIPCTSVGKGEHEELTVAAQIYNDKEAEEAVALRKAAGKASVGKYQAIDRMVCSDGRVKGLLQYHGAHTGRWAGRGIQPQNFPRVQDEDRDAVDMTLQLLSSDMRPSEIVDTIEFLIGEEAKAPRTLDVLSKCLRAMIVAPPGKKLVGGDFSNVEGRVNAWLAGEHWKLEAFKAFDAGTGPDLYKVTSASITAKRVDEVTKAERQATGKVPELALGYQGGVGAFINMAANYGTKPWQVAAVARSNTHDADWQFVAKDYEESRSYGLDEQIWTGIKVVVNKWREANANIVQGWWDLQDAAVAAVSSLGTIFPVYGGRVRYMASKGFLWCSLPSKRVLAYAYPRLIESEHKGRVRKVVEYDGVDSLTKRWSPQTLYGGEQCNHVVQGTARDLMVAAMLAAEREGLPVVLTVHDELLCEVPNGSPEAHDEAELQRIMSTLPEWAEGLPLAAATWSDYRYIK